MRLEVDVERWVVAQAWSRFGVASLKGTTLYYAGASDRVFWTPGGRPLIIEFKRPGEAPSARQNVTHAYLRHNGYNVEVHMHREEAIESIRKAVENAR